MREFRKRSIAKAISYRIICIIMLSLITYWITGDIFEMTSIVVVFQSIQMFVYYFHERLWERTNWGCS
ncbi:putative membrane protein [Thermoplasmatales archaeon SCGC AB-539-N05]|nr:putative membrane protein [Thermoplasmatales archaeon SCGC AB-539-N05]